MMANSGAASVKSLSPDELIALNEEVSSLVRAGVALPAGLRALATDSSGGLSQVSAQLAERMERGETLTQALAGMGDAVPSVYAAVIESGHRAGRLPEALETMTRLAKSAQEIRNQLMLAAILPLTVVVTAYALFVAFVVFMVPQLQQTYVALDVPQNWWINGLVRLGETAKYWAAIPPLACLFGWIVLRLLRLRTSDGAVSGGLFEVRGFRWVPGIRSVARTWHWANFADIWSLLVSHNVVLHEAIYLASRATGDRRIIRTADGWIAQLQSGRSLPECFAGRQPIPTAFRWLSGDLEGQLVPVLTRISNLLRRRARYQADWLKVLVPVGMVIFIGGGVTLVYGLTLFYTMAELYNGLALP